MTSQERTLSTAEAPMRTGQVMLLSGAHFINDTYPGFVAPLLPLLMEKIGFGLTLAAVLTSIMSVFNSLAQPLFGHFADRMKRPLMVVVGPLVTALVLGSIGVLNSYGAIVIALIISGFGTSAFHPQAAVMTAHASGARKGLGMSIFVTGGSAGHSLGPVIIMLVVTYLGLEYSPITILYGVPFCYLLFRYLPDLPHAPKHRKYTASVGASPHRLLLLLALWFIVTIRAFIITGFITFIPILLHQKQLSLLLAGSAVTTFELAGSAGALVGGPLSDRFGRKSIIVVSFLASLPLLWLFLVSSGWLAFLFLGLAGAVMYLSMPVTIIMAQELFPSRVNTVSSLVMGMAWGVGGLLVTPLGAMAERTNITWALQLLIGLGIISFIISLFLPETKRSHVIGANSWTNKNRKVR